VLPWPIGFGGVSVSSGQLIKSNVRIEMDGDLHIALQDATGNRRGIVVAEIPAKLQ